MKMNRGMMLAVTVAIGSFLQGWVCVVLFGHPSYMKEELQDSVVWVVLTIGILLAILSGRLGWIGRRPLLVASSLVYLFCSGFMLLSDNHSLILVLRLLDGFTWGFSPILMVFYFMETAHRRFRRLLLPQLPCLCVLCLGSIVEMPLVNWVAFSLSLLYFILVLFYLPESPKWLYRNGRIDEARHVLQILHGSNGVSDEKFKLVHGIRLESASSVEDLHDKEDLEYGPEDVSSENISKPVTLSAATQQGSTEDSLLTFSGNVDEESLTGEGGDSMPNAADASVLKL